MEGIALDFKAPLFDLVLANDSTFLSPLPFSACPKWCFIPFYVPVMLGTSCLHVPLLQMLLSSWRSCIHLPSFPQMRSQNSNRKKARVCICIDIYIYIYIDTYLYIYISRTQQQQHTWRIQAVLPAWQIPSVISWTKRIVSSRSKGLMRKRRQMWLIHRALVRVLNQNNAFSNCPFYKLNSDKMWRL